MSIADKLQTILENEQKVYNAGYEKGKSEGGGGGEKPTLFAPTIAVNSESNELTITDNRNGDFVESYELYANDAKVTELTIKNISLSRYIDYTRQVSIKVIAKGEGFKNSDFSNVEIWVKANENGTPGLKYSSGANSAGCDSIGTATEADIIISSTYDGLPVKYVSAYAFSYKSQITSVIIPASVEFIYMQSFYGCINLLTVEIQSTYCNIYETVFGGCTNLKRIDLSKCTSIAKLDHTSAFENTHADLQIKVPANLIDEWKSATNWSNWADKIVTEFTNEL